MLLPDPALKSADVIAWMKKTVAQHGAPEIIRSDNGSEFIAKELQVWLAKEKIKTIYIEPGSPWQNGFVESFHERFRDECLNREQLWTLTEARVVIEDFRIKYNTQHPIVSLGIGVRRIMWPSWHDLRFQSAKASLHRRSTNQDFCYNLESTPSLTLRVARKGESCQRKDSIDEVKTCPRYIVKN